MQFFAVFLFVRFLNNFAMRVRTRTRLISKTLTWDTSRCQMSLLLLSICCRGVVLLQLQPSMGRATCYDKRQRQTALGMTIEMQLTGQAQLRRQLPSHHVAKSTKSPKSWKGERGRVAFIIVFKCFEVCFVFVFDLVTGTPEKSLGNSCGTLPACNTPNMLLI